jgi:hypothetical protein
MERAGLSEPRSQRRDEESGYHGAAEIGVHDWISFILRGLRDSPGGSFAVAALVKKG